MAEITTEINDANVYNREMVLDLTLEAFYLYDMSHLDEPTSPKVHDYVPVPKSVISSVIDIVLDTTGAVVTDIGGEDVTTGVQTTANRNKDLRFENFKLLTTIGTNFTLTEYNDYTFKDFSTLFGVPLDFSSFMITGQDITEDFLRKKQAIYLVVHCERTETIYTLTTEGAVELARQSSCLVQAHWDFNNTPSQGKFGKEFEAYRLNLPQPVSPESGDLFDYGPLLVETKNKLRGSGDALSIQFRASSGKDMKLIGWGILGYKVDEP